MTYLSKVTPLPTKMIGATSWAKGATREGKLLRGRSGEVGVVTFITKGVVVDLQELGWLFAASGHTQEAAHALLLSPCPAKHEKKNSHVSAPPGCAVARIGGRAYLSWAKIFTSALLGSDANFSSTF